ncbi:MAG: response regulator transcription factor [Roseburia sp.]|nr:response regulator transcription factor [Roseburia sp.]
MNSKILIIEDEALIRRELKILLENAMYEAAALTCFDHIVPQIKNENPDLILLDINLPTCSGFDLCTQIREEMNVPIIFLTGRTDSMDELTGILKGGDDYITKPYHAPILLARISAVLKRTKSSHGKDSARLSHKGVILDTAGCSLFYMDRQADLTKTEMKILHQLFTHPGAFISRMDLTEYLWENQIFIDDNTLSVHITRVREKLRSIGVDNFIETKRGIGYRI